MELRGLLFQCGIHTDNVPDIDIKSLHHDSRTVGKGGLFFALHGTREDGVNFVSQAIERGAAAIVCQKGFGCNQAVCIEVEDVRKTMSKMAKAFYGGYCDKMQTVAVVGTNGKTTVANMLLQLLPNVGVIGTLGVEVKVNEKYEKMPPTGMTTPDPIDLHRIIKEMYERGVRTVVMEATAHAIHFRKLAGIAFDVGIFTNITQDHLDFFPSYESYSNTKIDFFIKSTSVRHAIVNIDCPAGVRILLARLKNRQTTLTYSIGGNADLMATDLRLFSSYSQFLVNGFCSVWLNMPARFNVSNALASIAAATLLGVDLEAVKEGLRSLRAISGRYDAYRIEGRGVTAIVDFAHTPDGLSKLLASVRETMAGQHLGGRIITVFGCGGNRDSGKRPLMGKVAAEGSDFVVITSDNPRNERPLVIMRQIEKGLDFFKDYVLIADRAFAIEYAINMARSGDVVVVAGKGGESHQEVGGVFHVYRDEDVINSIIKICETTHIR